VRASDLIRIAVKSRPTAVWNAKALVPACRWAIGLDQGESFSDQTDKYLGKKGILGGVRSVDAGSDSLNVIVLRRLERYGQIFARGEHRFAPQMHHVQRFREAAGEPDTTAAIAESTGEPVDRVRVVGGGFGGVNRWRGCTMKRV
jgi:hypothetical protein